VGFFDSMKGFLGGVGSLVSDVFASPIGQQFAGAGINLAFESLFGRNLAGRPVNQPGGAPVRQQFPQIGINPFPSPQFTQRRPVNTTGRINPFAPGGTPTFPQLPMPQIFAPTIEPFDPFAGIFGGTRSGSPRDFGGGQVPSFPTDRMSGGGFQPAAFDIPGFDLVNPFVAQGAGSNTCAPMFRPTQASISPAPLVMVPNPMTGAPTFFKHAGKPILFSGDLRAAKMVGKLARRARKAVPRR